MPQTEAALLIASEKWKVQMEYFWWIKLIQANKSPGFISKNKSILIEFWE